MKKFMAIVMTLAMVISMMTVVSFAAGEPTFRLTSATAKAGETVTLSMMVENNPGITACAIAVEYPEGITLTKKATNKNLFSGGSVVVGGNASNNPYKVNWSEDFDNFYENGEFYTLEFQVAADAEPGNYEIVVSYDQADVYNADMDDVEFATVNGVITVAADKEEGFGDIVVAEGVATVDYYFAEAKGNYDLIIASYNEVNGALELDKVTITTFEANGEGKATAALDGATGTVVKAFLWNADNMAAVK